MKIETVFKLLSPFGYASILRTCQDKLKSCTFDWLMTGRYLLVPPSY